MIGFRFCVAALVVWVAPVAEAQEGACARYRYFLDAAPSAFESVRGRDISIENGAPSTGLIFEIVGAPAEFGSCGLTRMWRGPDMEMWMVSCFQMAEDRATAVARDADEHQLMRKCFADWDTTPPDPVPSSPSLAAASGEQFERWDGEIYYRHGSAWADRQLKNGRREIANAVVFTVSRPYKVS